MRLTREGKRISRHYYFPRSQDAIPEITLTLPKKLAHSTAGLPVVKNEQPVLIRVDIPPEDRWLMNESLYEVGFFLDKAFLAEEEQGYVPISFLWRPKALSPGTHLLSVNTLFSGEFSAGRIVAGLFRGIPSPPRTKYLTLVGQRAGAQTSSGICRLAPGRTRGQSETPD
jgi:hypothetical protein